MIKLGDESNLYLEYIEMLNNIENDTKTKNLLLEREIRQLSGRRNRMSVALAAGT